MQDLNVGTNSSFGGSINDAGHIVGTFTTDYDLNTEGRDHAFLYANGTVVDLSAQFGRYLVPGGINNSGHFVGTVATDGGELSSFIYSNGSFVMPDFGFPTRMSDINDGGLIAGSAIFPGQTDFHAAFFHNGSVIDLGLPSGAVNGQAGRLNDRGEVVGISYRADGRHHGFVYSRGRISNAGTLPGDQQSWMSDINNRRVAVGASESPDEFARAVVWANGVLRDLNRLIPRHSGWFLHHANAINDRGQIVGVGFKDGEYRAFLLTPVKPPPLPKRGKED